MSERFSVASYKWVLDDGEHIRWYIQDNDYILNCYDVMYKDWAEKLCEVLNAQEDKYNQVLGNLDNLEKSICELLEKYDGDEIKCSVLKEVIKLKKDKEYK